jgi:hypothetical protein
MIAEHQLGEVKAFLEECELVADPNDSGSWTLFWTSVDYGNDQVSLRVILETNRDTIPDQVWKIRAYNTVEVNLKARSSHGAAILEDHPLLWGYKENVTGERSGSVASRVRVGAEGQRSRAILPVFAQDSPTMGRGQPPVGYRGSGFECADLGRFPHHRHEFLGRTPVGKGVRSRFTAVWNPNLGRSFRKRRGCRQPSSAAPPMTRTTDENYNSQFRPCEPQNLFVCRSAVRWGSRVQVRVFDGQSFGSGRGV